MNKIYDEKKHKFPSRMFDAFLGAFHNFLEYWDYVVRTQYGDKGKWGRGRWEHGTRKGPGRRPLDRVENPAGTKLVRKFVRQSRNENTPMRLLYRDLTGHNIGDEAEEGSPN